MSFEHPPYSGHKDQPLLVHLGEYPSFHLHVERHARTRQELTDSVKSRLDEGKLGDDELLELLKDIILLLSEAPSLDEFLVLVKFAGEAASAGSEVRNETAAFLGVIDTHPSFIALPPTARFRVLAELAHRMAQPDVAGAELSPGFKQIDLARQLYNLAADIARSGDGVLSPSLIARYLQGRYQIECAQPSRSDCFYALFDLITMDLPIGPLAQKTFLGDFLTELERASELGRGLDVSTEGFIARIAADPALIEYWILFAEASSVSPKIETQVRATKRLRDAVALADAIIEKAGLEL